MIGGVVSELGKKLAERWLIPMILAGSLYLGVAVCASVLGQAHSLDLVRLSRQLTVWAKDPAIRTVGGQAVVLAAVLGGATAAGLTVRLIGRAVEGVVLAPRYPGLFAGPAARLVDRRRRRWSEARDDYLRARETEARALVEGTPCDPGPRLEAYERMTAIARTEPVRPTWSGDRMNTVTVLLDHDCHIVFSQVWPILWLHLPDEVRSQITAARDALSRASELAGWSMLYALLLPLWWPALPVAVVVGFVCHHRFRAAVEAYAALLENVVRLYVRSLHETLGGSPTPRVGPDLGDELTALLGS